MSQFNQSVLDALSNMDEDVRNNVILNTTVSDVVGKMLSDAQNQASLATGAWWMYFPPGIAIALTTLSFAFIGIAFDEIVNPRLRKR